MDKFETAKILAVLKATYPNFYRNMPEDEIDGIISIWAEMFADEPYELVAAATKALIATDEKGFPPHIGAVKSRIRRLMEPEQMTEAEAWGLILKALKNGAYGSQSEFDKLPPMLRRLVGGPSQLRDWAMMDTDTVQSVIASNFQRSFRARSESERELYGLPADVRALVDSISGRLALDGGERHG